MGQAVDPVLPCIGITSKNLLHLGLSGQFFRPEELTRLTGAGANADAEARQIAAMAPESVTVVWVQAVAEIEKPCSSSSVRRCVGAKKAEEHVIVGVMSYRNT